jgi:hypothetical protein
MLRLLSKIIFLNGLPSFNITPTPGYTQAFFGFRFIQAKYSMLRPALNYFTTAFIRIALPTKINYCRPMLYEPVIYNLN